MLLTLGNEHRNHLQIFAEHTGQVVVDFCKLALDYLQNGYNLKRYNIAAHKLGVTDEQIQNVVDGLVYLLIESCKYKLTEDEVKQSLAAAEFSEEHQAVFAQFYNNKKLDILKILPRLGIRLATYQDLEWRFEVQVATSASDDIRPSVTLDLILNTLKPPPCMDPTRSPDTPSVSDDKILKLTAEGDALNQHSVQSAIELTHDVKHVLLQTDLPNLVNLVTSLESAYLESKTHHVKRMQRAFTRKQ